MKDKKAETGYYLPGITELRTYVNGKTFLKNNPRLGVHRLINTNFKFETYGDHIIEINGFRYSLANEINEKTQ